MEVQITNGSVKYGETRKIADFENKRADVELSFNVAEGQDYHGALETVIRLTKTKCFEMLSGKPAPEHLISAALQSQLISAAMQSPPPSQNITATEVEERVKAHSKAAHSRRAPVPKMPEPLKSMDVVSDPAAIAEPAPSVADLGALAEPAITDAMLMDATSKQQERVKNAVAVRKLINECGVKTPPGRLIEMPQDQRQKYLDGLKEIKPLA